MTVTELIRTLQSFPPLMEVYVQTISTGLNKVEEVEKDNGLGIIELKWNTRDVMPPKPSVYPMEKPIDIMDVPKNPFYPPFEVTTNDTQSTSKLDWMHRDTKTFYGD